ncbi:MAG: peptidoglycan DD-metalloendopeptidase family protein [Bacteroidaceae bacterium]|nr:peptidoglycan DD-metalloendopeptidase family protein [Bacteroidaceae bacterium]
MLIDIIHKSSIALLFAALSLPAAGQDLIARQAPVDKKMRAIDSVAIQRLFEQENLEDPASDLYPNWEESFINAYGNVELPQELKIDLRHFCMPTSNRIVTSQYGYRRRFRRQHKGLDIDANKGDTIRSAFDGKVRVVTFQRGGYGNVVVIRHTNGLETVYGHLSKHLTKVGSVVKAGDPIGLAGNTGRSYGAHLHFETRLLGEYIDPSKLFDFAHQDVTGDFYVFRGRGRGTLIGKHDPSAPKVEGTDLAETSSAETADEEISYESSEVAKNNQRAQRAARNTRIHKVKKGETLSSIAKKHRTTVAALCRANGISTRTKLRIGQILKYS